MELWGKMGQDWFVQMGHIFPSVVTPDNGSTIMHFLINSGVSDILNSI